MKKLIYPTFIFVLMIISTSVTFGSSAPEAKHTFRSTGREIDFDVERAQGEISLFFQSAAFGTYDEILVERSESENGIYSVCKTIEVPQTRIADGYYKTADKYPTAVQKDCYYRIKTIAKDGVIKTYPPVLLSAISK